MVDIDTPAASSTPSSPSSTPTGTLVAFNDDAGGLDSLHRPSPCPPTGTYYVAVAGFPTFPADPFDSGSGDGVGSEGPYNVTLTVGADDVDFYAVDLRKGDVLGASVTGAATRLTVLRPGRRRGASGSTQDATFIYPPTSPLPGGGNAVAEHVADETGWHYVGVDGGDGAYDITVEVYRPTLEALDRPVQTLFLDFDGARVNTGICGGPGVRQLSPLRAFLGRWGLTHADENAVIDRIVADRPGEPRDGHAGSGPQPELPAPDPQQPRPRRPVRPGQRQPRHRRRHDRRVRHPDHRHRPVHRPGQLRDRGDGARAARRAERPGRRLRATRR